MIEALAMGARAIHVVTLMAAFGGALFPLYAGGSRGAPRWAITLALPSALACAMLEAARILGWSGLVDANALLAMFAGTAFGRAWLVHIALTLVLFALASTARRRLSVLVAAAALASLAGIGHSGMHEGVTGMVHRFTHAAHLLAVGAWFGGLEPLRQTILTATRAIAERATARFSSMGAVAVVVALAAGVANIALIKGNAAFANGYLLALSIKLSAVFAILCLAAYNRFVAAHPFQPRLLLRSIRLEQGIFLVAVLVAVVLATLAPTGATFAP